MSKKYLIGILVLVLLIAAVAYGYLHLYAPKNVASTATTTMATQMPLTAKQVVSTQTVSSDCAAVVAQGTDIVVASSTVGYGNEVDPRLVRIHPEAGHANVLPWYYKDACHVYNQNSFAPAIEIPGANPNTFVLLYNDDFSPTTTCDGPECLVRVDVSKDKNAVYVNGKVVPGADPQTFVLIKDTQGDYTLYGKDNAHIFILGNDYYTNVTAGTILSGADPKTFVATSPTDGHDAIHTYVQGIVQ